MYTAIKKEYSETINSHHDSSLKKRKSIHRRCLSIKKCIRVALDNTSSSLVQHTVEQNNDQGNKSPDQSDRSISLDRPAVYYNVSSSLVSSLPLQRTTRFSLLQLERSFRDDKHSRFAYKAIYHSRGRILRLES